MHPVTRQRTLESILSWWSDSNPPGATISLHAAAKPLMKILYHRQVLGFIERTRGGPFSEETLGIYSDYLAFKYISHATKNTILKELGSRASWSEADVRAVVHSPILYQVAGLLESSDAEIRRRTCMLVAELARNESSAVVVLGFKPCARLTALLR
ncbi:hypothetical protein C8R44DRAFT_814529 [Mycena epipterygia]|nr:hypothetical protein C8R44DRAFT_814529 [Mycena epipterygia]